MSGQIPPIDMEEMLAQMAPPSIPDQIIASGSAVIDEVRTWNKLHSSRVLAGLLVDPRYHANDIRIDWLQRLVLAHAAGKKKPRIKAYSRVLNRGFVGSNVHFLEDPIEDLFCDLIATSHGNFRIFLGRWEAATAYTQTIIDAFACLPDHDLKQTALTAVYSLLRISDQLASRMSLDRESHSSGTAMGTITLASDARLNRLSRVVKFSQRDLEGLGVELGALEPFILKEEQFPLVSDRGIGDTPLELHPLLRTDSGITVVAPSNISLAVRSILINTAMSGGMEAALQRHLLVQQENYSQATGFWPSTRLHLPPGNKHFVRGVIQQYGKGRYLHVVQLPVPFKGFPGQAFASIRQLSGDAAQFVRDDVQRFWQFLEERGDCRRSSTVLLLSGWGAPCRIASPLPKDDVPEHWSYLPLSFADTAILGACENGKFDDLMRVVELSERAESDGYTFANPNGLLNLFSYWRQTEGNFVPEHKWEIEPPCNILMGVDEVLVPRREFNQRQDRRALPLPGGGFKVVQRINWGDELKPIYASASDLEQSRLCGAVSIGERTWWIETEAKDGEPRGWRYQVWNAVLEWIGAVGADLAQRHPALFPPGSVRIKFELPESELGSVAEFKSVDPARLAECVSLVASEPNENSAVVKIEKDWRRYLRQTNNAAEIELVAAILEANAVSAERHDTRGTIVEAIRRAIGSDDWRWLHVLEADKPLQRLAAQGLVPALKKIPFSASSLVKWGSVWNFRSRSAGSEIDGETDCREFLRTYRDEILKSLIRDVRQFDRKQLVTCAAHAFQSARREQIWWRSTIRALRSIKGAQADKDAFERNNEANGVIRASKSILEIAACEAPLSGGVFPAQADIDEMFAKALMLFGNGQLFATIRGGLIPAKLRVSPGGDVLSERTVLQDLLRPSASWLHGKSLDEGDKKYGTPLSPDDEVVPERLEWGAELRKAVETEFGVSAEAYSDFQFAVVQIAEKREQGVFLARHSDLIDTLTRNDAYPDVDTRPLLNRLTLQCRSSWHADLGEPDIDLSRFDRAHSLINRPLLGLDSSDDPLVLVAPTLLSDSIMYSISGLHEGFLQNAYWCSAQARSYAGAQAKATGEKFEERVEGRLRELGLDAKKRSKLSALLNLKVPNELGDVDVFALSKDKRTAWVIEAKDIKLCRTEAEIAARLSEYRGQMIQKSNGKEKPDKLLKHLRRVRYIRERSDALAKTLKLSQTPKVKGLLIFDCPQPMNFEIFREIEDAESIFLDQVETFKF